MCILLMKAKFFLLLYNDSYEMVPGWPAEYQRRVGQPAACPPATGLRYSSLARDSLLKFKAKNLQKAFFG